MSKKKGKKTPYAKWESRMAKLDNELEQERKQEIVNKRLARAMKRAANEKATTES